MIRGLCHDDAIEENASSPFSSIVIVSRPRVVKHHMGRFLFRGGNNEGGQGYLLQCASLPTEVWAIAPKPLLSFEGEKERERERENDRSRFEEG